MITPQRTKMRFRVEWRISVCITLILCWARSVSAFAAATKTDTHPTDVRELKQSLDKIFAEEMEKEHIPGAVFVLVKDGAVLFSKG
jgi:hypothetical protein